MHREVPPFPRIPSRENLEGTITTRILAERLNRQRESQFWSENETSTSDSLKSESLRSGRSSEDRSRNSLRSPVTFLRGAALPNSVAKSMSQAAEPAANKDDRETRKAKRDAYVAEVIRRLQMKLYPPIEAAPSELQGSEDVATSTTGDKISELSLRAENTSIVSKSDQASPSVSFKEVAAANRDHTERERMRIIRRTSVLSPLPYKKLPPTPESIQNAISNSKAATKVLDVNSMERKKQSASKDTLGAFNLTGPSWGTLKSRAMKASRASRRMAGKYLQQKSILKRTSPDVAVSENRKEDSQTQTVLKMKDLKDARRKFVVGTQ